MSPRTQAALLEAMEEGQVSTDGMTRALPQPHLVIATQNPSEHQGTFHCPTHNWTGSQPPPPSGIRRRRTKPGSSPTNCTRHRSRDSDRSWTCTNWPRSRPMSDR